MTKLELDFGLWEYAEELQPLARVSQRYSQYPLLACHLRHHKTYNKPIPVAANGMSGVESVHHRTVTGPQWRGPLAFRCYPKSTACNFVPAFLGNTNGDGSSNSMLLPPSLVSSWCLLVFFVLLTPFSYRLPPSSTTSLAFTRATAIFLVS